MSRVSDESRSASANRSRVGRLIVNVLADDLLSAVDERLKRSVRVLLEKLAKKRFVVSVRIKLRAIPSTIRRPPIRSTVRHGQHTRSALRSETNSAKSFEFFGFHTCGDSRPSRRSAISVLIGNYYSQQRVGWI